jgi:predicted anti-sigma-YlaC factor YlaD
MGKIAGPNTAKDRFISLVGGFVLGVIFIGAGTYLWWPLIIIGMIVIVLGYLLADEVW